MKFLGLDLSFSGKEPSQPEMQKTSSRKSTLLEMWLTSSSIKALLEQATSPANKIELLRLYEVGLSAPHCPMSPLLSNYILDIGLNDPDQGVRKAANDVVIKSLSHDTILSAWDANRDGQTEELTDVLVACLSVANDISRDNIARFDAFIVAEKIIMRLPERATESVQSLLTRLGVSNNAQLAEKAHTLLYYVERQLKEDPVHDAASALRVLAEKGVATLKAEKFFVN